MTNSIQSFEYLIAGIAISIILIFITSVGFYFSVPSSKSKQCLRSCPFTLWGISNTLTFVVNAFIDIAYVMWGFFTIRFILASIMLITASVSCYQFHEDVLRNVDDAWRIWIHPILHDVAEPLILLLRFFYNILNPLYNFYIGAFYQITRGSVIIIGKCQIEGLYMPLRHVSNATIHLSESVITFLQDTSRPLDITEGAHDALMAVHTMQNGLKCACKQTEIATDVLFYGGKVMPFAFAINSMANVPIQFTRDLVTGVFGNNAASMPTFKRTFNFFNDGLIKFGIGVDEWGYYAIDKYGLIDKEKAPLESIASAMARTGVAALSVPEDILSGSLNLLNSPTKVQIRQSYSFDTAWRNMDVAAHAAGKTLHFWVDFYATRLTGESSTSYSCEWDEDNEFTPLSITIGCVAEHSLKAAFGLPHVIWSTTMKSIFRSSDASDILTILQRHDGAWMKRTGLLSCEYRKEHSLVGGLPPPEQLLVDHMTNSEDCECTVDSYFTDPMVGYTYNPWCNAPNLQAQVFNHLDTVIVFSTRGLFGPLAGLVNSPPRLFMEFIRIAIRIIFSFPDMVEGTWASRQLQCGYGVENNFCDDLYTHGDDSTKCLNNAQDGCYCDWEKNIESTSGCECILDYPIFTTTFEETQSVDTRFQKAAGRWCNTMIFEHMLQLVEQSGDSLEYVFHYLGKEVNAAQDLGKRCYHYELASMSTTAQLGGFEADVESSSQLCSAWGYENVFCGLGGSTKALVRLATSTYRQMAMNIIKLLQGNIEGLKLDLSPRICDAERVASMLASSLSGTLIFSEFPQREAIGKLLFSLEEAVFLGPLKVLHRIYYTLVSILKNIVSTGRFDSDQVSNTFKTLIVDVLTTVFDVLKIFLGSLEEFFNTLGNTNPKPGAIFGTLKNVVNDIQNIMTSSFLDILAEVSNIFIQLLSLLSGSTDFGGGIVSMLKSVSNIIGEFVKIASSNIMLLIEAFLSLLGPFGDVLKMIAGTLCDMVKTIASLPIINEVANGDSIQCFDGGRRLSFAGEVMTITAWANHVFKWEGNSVCDQFMRETNQPLESLTALEKATWKDCLTSRFIGEKIQEHVGIPELKLYDVAYNYQRKYEVGYELFENIRLSYGIKKRTEVYNTFLDAHMDVHLHMHLYDKLSAFSRRTWKAVEITANDFNKDNIPDSSAHAFAKVMKSLKKFNTREWVNEKKHFWTTLDVVPHLMNMSKPNPFYEVASRYKRSSEIVQETTGAAVFTDISGGGFADCTLVDNFFTMADAHAKSIGKFYSTYIPATIDDIESYGQRPSFESKLENQNYTGATFSSGAKISRWEFARQDWTNLFDGDRLNKDDLYFVIDAVSAFLTRTNDTYVPLFGVGLPYCIIYPLFESCDIQKHVFVNEAYEDTPSFEERVDLVPTALMNVMIYVLAISYSSTWSPLPIGILNSWLLLALASWFIYAYTIYSYLPTCWPNTPYTLLEDFYGFVVKNRANSDFCSYIPIMYPVEGGCGSSVTDAPTYKSCEALVPEFQKGMITEDGDIKLGTIFWPLITFVRYNFAHWPIITQFLEFFGPLSDDLKKWRGNFEVTEEEEACMKIMAPTVVCTGFMFVFFVYVFLKLSIAAVRTALNAAITTFTLYNHTRDILENIMDQEDELPVQEERDVKQLQKEETEEEKALREEKKRKKEEKRRKKQKKDEKLIEDTIGDLKKDLEENIIGTTRNTMRERPLNFG